MKRKPGAFTRSLAIMLALSCLALATTVLAERVGVTGIADAAIAVDVIVDIDTSSRAITLKNEQGEEWVFVAGPEVRNFDQLKRGDLVIMEYLSGLAIALEPKGSGLKERVSELEVERAKAGEKPGVKITESTYAAAEITAIDVEQGLVGLEGARGALVLKVGENIDLTGIETGQEVEALYVESYVISVEPAPKVSGTVAMKTTTLAIGVGVQWGEGTFTMYDGKSYDLKISGLTVADIGISKAEAEGEVYNVVEAKDLEGIFVAGEAGGSLVGGGSVITMKNENGVVMKLKSTQKGARLTLAGEGLRVVLQ